VTVLEDTKRVTIRGDVQTLHEDTDHRRQNGPQSKTQTDYTPPSEMILLMKNEKQCANSSRYTFWMHNKKIVPVVYNGMRCATFDRENVSTPMMKPYKFYMLDKVSHPFNGIGGHFRQSR